MFGKRAGSGVVDICVPDANNPETLLAASVSTRTFQDLKSDVQAARHRKAIANSIRAEGILNRQNGGKPFRDLRYSVYHGSLLYTDVTEARQINRRLADELVNPRHREAVNFLSFLSSAKGLSDMCQYCDIYDLLGSQQRPFSSAGIWDGHNLGSNAAMDEALGKILVDIVQRLSQIESSVWESQTSHKDVMMLLTDAVTLVSDVYPKDHPVRTSLMSASPMVKEISLRFGENNTTKALKNALFLLSGDETKPRVETDPIDDVRKALLGMGGKRLLLSKAMDVARKNGWAKGDGDIPHSKNTTDCGFQLGKIAEYGPPAMIDLVFGRDGNERLVSISTLHAKLMEMRKEEMSEKALNEACQMMLMVSRNIEASDLSRDEKDLILLRFLKNKMHVFIDGAKHIDPDGLAKRYIAASVVMREKQWELNREPAQRLLLLAEHAENEATNSFCDICELLASPSSKVSFFINKACPSMKKGAGYGVSHDDVPVFDADTLEQMKRLLMTPEATHAFGRGRRPAQDLGPSR